MMHKVKFPWLLDVSINSTINPDDVGGSCFQKSRVDTKPRDQFWPCDCGVGDELMVVAVGS